MRPEHPLRTLNVAFPTLNGASRTGNAPFSVENGAFSTDDETLRVANEAFYPSASGAAGWRQER